jgi:UDP-glucose 4-epimerase
LIEAATAAGCKNFVFSSTCATYGDQDNVVLDEDSAQYPINSYGASKRAIEDILRDFEAAYGLRHVIFRYFNVAGADPDGEVGEFHQPETHLIPLMLDAIDGKRDALTIFGTDYDTPDGTCIRDYVHVCDLVDAHVLGLKWLQDDKGSRVFNLGTGTGFSVREVIDHSRSVTNREVPFNEGSRRAGDCTKLVSGSSRAVSELGWNPARSNLETMIADAWRWHQTGRYSE